MDLEEKSSENRGSTWPLSRQDQIGYHTHTCSSQERLYGIFTSSLPSQTDFHHLWPADEMVINELLFTFCVGALTAGHRGVRPFDWAPGTSLATGAPLSAGAWPPPAKRWQRNEKYFTRSITYGYGLWHCKIIAIY